MHVLGLSEETSVPRENRDCTQTALSGPPLVVQSQWPSQGFFTQTRSSNILYTVGIIIHLFWWIVVLRAYWSGQVRIRSDSASLWEASTSYRETRCQVHCWHTPSYIYSILAEKARMGTTWATYVNITQMNSTLCLDCLLADLQRKGRRQWLCSMLHFFISKAVDTAAGASKTIMQSPINGKG